MYVIQIAHHTAFQASNFFCSASMRERANLLYESTTLRPTSNGYHYVNLWNWKYFQDGMVSGPWHALCGDTQSGKRPSLGLRRNTVGLDYRERENKAWYHREVWSRVIWGNKLRFLYQSSLSQSGTSMNLEHAHGCWDAAQQLAGPVDGTRGLGHVARVGWVHLALLSG